MKNQRIVASLGRIRMTGERKEAVLSEILTRADRERAHAARETPASPRNKWKTTFRRLAPVAAALIALGILLSIPEVSGAVRSWFVDLFRVGHYMQQNRGAEDPDMEKAITDLAAGEQSYEILLLDEIPDNESYDAASIDAWRVKLGQKPFDRADWAWIQRIEPRVERVLYDGKQLVMNVFLQTDPVPFARGVLTPIGEERPSVGLDWDYALSVNGENCGPYMSSMDVDFSKWQARSHEPDFELSELRADGGVYVNITVEFPISPGLPDGICQVALTELLLDNFADDMSIVGLVGQITQRFSFDTREGNRLLTQAAGTAIPLTGTFPYTVRYYDERVKGARQTVTEQIDLTGVTLTPVVSRRSTGIHVALQYAYPESGTVFTEEVRRAVESCMEFDLYIDGTLAKRLSPGGSPDALTVEIPLTPTEAAGANAILLRPVVVEHRGVREGGTALQGCDILVQ